MAATSRSAEPESKPPGISKPELQKLMGAAYIPGMSIATVSGGRTSGSSALGVSDIKGTPTSENTENTAFCACSLSKPMFGYLVYKLIEANKSGTAKPKGIFKNLPPNVKEFDLNTSLYLIKKNDKFSALIESEAITSSMILSHSSGLPDDPKSLKFDFEPNTSFSYSGEGFLYLQRVIEALTGHSLEELAQENIFTPFEMEHSHFSLPAETKVIHATNYDDTRTPQRPPREGSAAASLRCPASDYSRFLEACLKDEGFIAALKNPVYQVSLKKDRKAADLKIEGLESLSWGLGFALQTTKEGTIAFHWGHGEGARAIFAMNLDLEIRNRNAVVYLANSDDGLAIAPNIVKQTVGNLEQGLNWLFTKYDYRKWNSEGWKNYHEALAGGLAAQAKGELASASGLAEEAEAAYTSAISLLKQAAANAPGDKLVKIEHRIKWLEALTQIKTVSPEELKKHEGEYGSYRVIANGSNLEIVEGKKKYNLIVIDANTFLCKGMDEKNGVILRFDVDSNRKPILLCGYYNDTEPYPRTTKIEKMLDSTFNRFPRNSNEFKKIIGQDGLNYLIIERPISSHENNFIQDHKDDFDTTSALAIRRRQYLTTILSSEKGIEALEQKLITLDQAMTMPHPHHLQALLSEQGFIALKEGLITPQDALKFGENSSLYLMELCTEKGISALRDAKNQGGSVLEDTIKAYVKHAHEYNNVGALEHSLKNGIPINQVQQTIKDNEPRSGLR